MKPPTRVAQKEIQNGVEDEFGVLYSKDGKRLLCCNNSDIQEYKVKDGTLVICDWAFECCMFLKYINISDSVTTIGRHAFGWSNLAVIVLPSSLKYIDESAIGSELMLNYIVVPDGSKKRFKRLLPEKFWWHICTMNEMRENFPLNVPFELMRPLFVPTVDGKILKGWCSMPDEMQNLYPNFTVSKGVEIIGSSAFSRANRFENILLPDSLVEIQEMAFSDCKMLKNIVLPKSLKKIGAFAFRGCESLVELTIPASVEEVEANPFVGCTNLNLKSESKRFVVEDDFLIDNETHTLVACLSNSCDVVIPNSVKYIGAVALGMRSNLQKVSIPDSVTFIDQCAFKGCSALENVDVPDSTTTNNSASQQCKSCETPLCMLCLFYENNPSKILFSE